jgi:F1F0 ATPase subunit 2
MAMAEMLPLVLAGGAGVALGALFFGGLWWTVCKAMSSPRPGLWFACSLLLRMTIALTGLYFAADGRWQRLVLCLAGFFLARLAVTRLTQPPRGKPWPPAREAGHAP